MRRISPFLKEEYFRKDEDRILYNQVQEFINKYNSLPTKDALKIEIDNLSIKEDQVKEILSDVEEIYSNNEKTNQDWLIDATENFCKEKAIYHAITTSIEIMNNKNSEFDRGAIPDLLSKALAVSFDPSVGHDYLESFEDRFDYYHRKMERIPFDLKFFNLITKDGIPKKTLNVILAGCVHPETKIKVRFRKRIAS